MNMKMPNGYFRNPTIAIVMKRITMRVSKYLFCESQTKINIKFSNENLLKMDIASFCFNVSTLKRYKVCAERISNHLPQYSRWHFVVVLSILSNINELLHFLSPSFFQLSRRIFFFSNWPFLSARFSPAPCRLASPFLRTELGYTQLKRVFIGSRQQRHRHSFHHQTVRYEFSY